MRQQLNAVVAIVAVLLVVFAGTAVFVRPATATGASPLQYSPDAGGDDSGRVFSDALPPGFGGLCVGVDASSGARYDALTSADVSRVRVENYSRRDGSDPLDHEGRSAVYDAVASSPGIYLARLSDVSDVPRSTVRYHVRVLERESLVRSEKLRGKRRFFPADVADVDLAAALHDDATAPVVDAISRTGPASVSALADELDVSAATASYHLSRLEEAGVVSRERVDNEVVNSLTPAARDVVDAAPNSV